VFGSVKFGPVVCVSGMTSWELLFSTHRTRHTNHRSKKSRCQTPTTHTKYHKWFQSSTFNTPWGWNVQDPKLVGVFDCLL